MTTDTLANGLKAVFGTSKTTGTNVPLVTALGAPDGNISMSALASVLGVVQYSTVNPDDLCEESGRWLCFLSERHEDLGFDAGTYCWVFSFYQSTSNCLQIVIPTNNSCIIFRLKKPAGWQNKKVVLLT